MNCTSRKQTQSALFVVPVWSFFHSLRVTRLGMKPAQEHGLGVRREAGLGRGPLLGPFLIPHDSGRAPLSCLTEEEPWQGQLRTKASASAGRRASTFKVGLSDPPARTFSTWDKGVGSPPEQRKPWQELFGEKSHRPLPGVSPSSWLGGKGQNGLHQASVGHGWGPPLVLFGCHMSRSQALQRRRHPG